MQYRVRGHAINVLEFLYAVNQLGDVRVECVVDVTPGQIQDGLDWVRRYNGGSVEVIPLESDTMYSDYVLAAI